MRITNFWQMWKRRSTVSALNVVPISSPAADLFPVPMPQLAEMEVLSRFQHLNLIEPIDSPDMLALHVAQLTMTVAELLGRIEQLEGRSYGGDCHNRSNRV